MVFERFTDKIATEWIQDDGNSNAENFKIMYRVRYQIKKYSVVNDLSRNRKAIGE